MAGSAFVDIIQPSSDLAHPLKDLLQLGAGSVNDWCLPGSGHGFRTANHEILLEKLQHYGIHDKCLSWY